MAKRPIRRGGLAWREVRIGAVLVLSLTLLVLAVVQVGQLFDVFADRYPLVMLVRSANGLLEGAPVTLAGQRVGQVEEIDFIPPGRAGENNLRIQVEINEEVQEHIRADSRARIRTQGLLGDKYIDITPGSPEAPILQPGDTLVAIEAVDYEDILADASATLREAHALVLDLRQITGSLRRGEGTLGRLITNDELYERLVGATTELRTTLAEINRADGTLGRLIRDPALYERIHSAVARIDTLGSAILHGEGTVSRLIQSDELYRGMVGVVGRADSAVAALEGTLGKLAEGEGTLQRLLSDPALYDEFLKAVVDLQTLINDIRENPRKYRPDVNVKVF